MKMNLLVLRRLPAKLVALMLFLASFPSVAELRVIIEYDESEHRLMRLVDLGDTGRAPRSDHIDPNLIQHSNAKVRVRWLNADGSLISINSIVDPRLTHAPLTDGLQAPTVVGLNTGAYLLTGPSSSAAVEIHLPANDALGLGAQTWRIELTQRR